MQYKEFGEKQLYTLTWWSDAAMHDYDAIICDGSIRAGKNNDNGGELHLMGFYCI